MNVQTSCSRGRRQIENTATIAICCSLVACLPLVVSSPVRADDTAHTARTYTFSIENGTYANLVNNFARQAGLNVVGDSPSAGQRSRRRGRDVLCESPSRGTVSLITAGPLTFDEALSRLRTLLFHVHPLDPYWLVVHETHVEVVRINDYYRNLPLDRIFAGLEEYQAASLPPNELALLVFKPENAGSKDLNVIHDFMPDYVRIRNLGDGQGAVSVFGLVRDIERYVKLVEKLHSFLETSEGAE